MVEIILLSYLAWRNSVLAKLKSQNQLAWAIYTVMAFLGCFMLGLVFVVFVFCRNAVDLNLLSSTDVAVREALAKNLVKIITGNPLHTVTVEMFGFGGYLITRYLLDRKPGKKEPEIHWMDKIGEQ
jgi:hypothetical protein